MHKVDSYSLSMGRTPDIQHSTGLLQEDREQTVPMHSDNTLPGKEIAEYIYLKLEYLLDVSTTYST